MSLRPLYRPTSVIRGHSRSKRKTVSKTRAKNTYLIAELASAAEILVTARRRLITDRCDSYQRKINLKYWTCVNEVPFIPQQLGYSSSSFI